MTTPSGRACWGTSSRRIVLPTWVNARSSTAETGAGVAAGGWWAVSMVGVVMAVPVVIGDGVGLPSHP